MKRDAVERGITSWQGILLILATIVKNPKLDRLIVFWAPTLLSFHNGIPGHR